MPAQAARKEHSPACSSAPALNAPPAAFRNQPAALPPSPACSQWRASRYCSCQSSGCSSSSTEAMRPASSWASLALSATAPAPALSAGPLMMPCDFSFSRSRLTSKASRLSTAPSWSMPRRPPPAWIAPSKCRCLSVKAREPSSGGSLPWPIISASRAVSSRGSASSSLRRSFFQFSNRWTAAAPRPSRNSRRSA